VTYTTVFEAKNPSKHSCNMQVIVSKLQLTKNNLLKPKIMLKDVFDQSQNCMVIMPTKVKESLNIIERISLLDQI
jgi:hypothetical protein